MKFCFIFWFRNEDLYKATTEKPTTAGSGLAPLFDRNLYKRPAPGSSPANGASLNFLPSRKEANANANAAAKNNPSNNPPPSRNSNNNNEDLDSAAIPAQRPGVRPLRRPYRRRRPQVDYYYYDDEYEEDVYEERGRRRQQRPRNRRPVYDDDYDSRRP